VIRAFGKPIRSASARTSAGGSIVVGRLPRVKRRVGFVVRRKSSSMLRNSAAFSNSIFSATVRICFSNSAINSRDWPSRKLQACSTRSR